MQHKQNKIIQLFCTLSPSPIANFKLLCILTLFSTHRTLCLSLLQPHQFTAHLPPDLLTTYALQTRSNTSVTPYPSTFLYRQYQTSICNQLFLYTPYTVSPLSETRPVCSPPPRYGAFIAELSMEVPFDCPRRKRHLLHTSRSSHRTQNPAQHASSASFF